MRNVNHGTNPKAKKIRISRIRTNFNKEQIIRIKYELHELIPIMTDILFKEESYKIIGACMEVHKKLGCGFLESVYAEALESEFKKVDVPYEREKKLLVFYDNKPLHKYFKADFVCYQSIMLELKASKFLTEADIHQTVNNVKATNYKLGLLINFGESSLVHKRILN